MLNSLEELFDTIRLSAERFPGSIALASRTGCMNYADLVGNIASVAEAAAGSGIRSGQLVVPAFGNPDMALIVTLALMRIGCRVGYTANLGLYEASGVAVNAVVADPASAQSLGRPVVPVTPDWFKGADAAKQQIPPVAGDFSIVFSSSGSTGRPKLIELPAPAVLRRASQRTFGAGARILPAFGSRTPDNLHDSIATLLKGGMITHPPGIRGTEILDTIQLFRPDYVCMAPSSLLDMVNVLQERLTALRKVGVLRTVGSRCSPELQDLTLEKVADTYMSNYGTVEIGWIAVGDAAQLRKGTGNAGRIIDDIEVAAFDDDGHILPPGTEGEIRAKGPEAAVGTYIGMGTSADSAFKDGWFATGDIGFVDENRNLILRGRTNNVINIGGSKVSPEEVEEHLTTLAGVIDVGVAGVDVPEGYEKIGAAVVSTASVSLDEINAYLRQRRFPWPVQEVKNVPAIPKTNNGKIDRVALRRLWMGDE